MAMPCDYIYYATNSDVFDRGGALVHLDLRTSGLKERHTPRPTSVI